MNNGGSPKGQGSLFKLTATGVYSVAYLFDQTTNVEAPSCGLAAVKGLLYGCTNFGLGTIFAFKP